MASKISNNDLDFLCMLDGENGEWKPDRKANGNEDAWGFCMFNRRWHSDIVDDERFFTDPEWQMQQCYNAYKNGVKFYGKQHCWKTKSNFTCP